MARFIKDDPTREADKLFELYWKKPRRNDKAEHIAWLASDVNEEAWIRAYDKGLVAKWSEERVKVEGEQERG